MIASQIHPAPAFNFWVLLWDVQGPASGVAEALVAGLAAAASGAIFGAFSDVSGLNAGVEIETYQEGGNNGATLKFPKWGKHDPLVLKRGVTPRTSLWDWHQQVLFGSSPVLRKSGLVILFDRGSLPEQELEGLRYPIAAWSLNNAFPENITGPTLDARNNTVAMESINLVHEGVERVSLSQIPGASDALSAFGGLLGGG